jgi:ABC-type dipeptide/oligopeptide/nickel transport system permease subunit
MRSFASRYARRADGMVGLIVLVLFGVLALFPDLFVGPLETATTATGNAFDPPSAAHVLGADELGRGMPTLTTTAPASR